MFEKFVLFLQRIRKNNNAKINKMTFQERYYEEKVAAKVFLLRCMRAAKVKEATVRCWLCGTRTPDALAKDALAKEFGVPVEELFPNQ